MFKLNGGGVEDANAFLHAKRLDVYANEKENLVKGDYLVKVVSHYGKKVI